jgi:DNA-binding MarR family transcriptional regulator
MAAEDVARLELSKRVSRLAVRHEQAMKAELAELGLTYAEFDVLAALVRAAGPLRPHELSQALFLTSGGTSNVLARLTAAGHVERTTDPADARGIRVTLTHPGRSIAEQAMAASIRVNADLLAGVPVDAIRAAADALRAVLAPLDRRRH